MIRLLAVLAIVLWLPGCAVVGIGLAAVAADNIMQGEDSYTNQALDAICEQTLEQKRLGDGTCPAPPEKTAR